MRVGKKATPNNPLTKTVIQKEQETEKQTHKYQRKIIRRRQTHADRCHLLPTSEVIHEQRVL